MGSEWLETVALFISWANDKLADWQSGGCDLEDPDDSDPDPTLVYVSPLGASGMAVTVYRAAVHATVGSYEDLEHVLHLRAKSGVTQDQSEAGLQALAARIAVAWAAWWNDQQNTVAGVLNNQATRYMFHPMLTYDHITMSCLTYPGGWKDEAAKVVNPPETVTPSTQYNFPTPLVGGSTGDKALPSEVALCLTLLTDQVGKRTRGRVYLGGLGATVMAPASSDGSIAGLFDFGNVKTVAKRFGVDIIDGLHTDSAATAEVNIVSRIGGTSRGVGGVRVGQVPDSQRRRRWHQPENAFLAWGTA
jgi:hypothetical protein